MKHPLKYETQIAKNLRKLCLDINKITRDSSIFSIASPIINNACDHLSAIARVHEFNNDYANTIDNPDK